MLVKRYFTTTASNQLLRALNNTLQKTSPKNFERKEVIKPIGQLERPSPLDALDKRSLIQRKNDWLKDENRLKRKENLEKEFATSGMYDMFIYRKTKGKVFISPKSYFKKDKALYFPNLIANENLVKQKNISTYNAFIDNGNHSKYSILRIFSNGVGEKHTKRYFADGENNFLNSNESYHQLLQKYPHSQVVNFSLYDNFFKKWLFKTFTAKNMAKKSVSEASYLKNYFLFDSSKFTVPFRETINYLNSVTGYIYIVDNSGKIRWLSSGDPLKSDLDTMWNTIKGLEHELQNNENS